MADGLIRTNLRYSNKDDVIIKDETDIVVDAEWYSSACGGC